MSTHLFGATSISPASRYVHAKQGNSFAASAEELSSLCFSIILTSRWETLASKDVERRNDLRAELAELRRQYSQKIDDMAIAFGVQNAMNAKEEVERTVTVPLGIYCP
jgi:hypothetical protein